MVTEEPGAELMFIYSEAQIEGDRFAIGLIPQEALDEVRTDYLEPILANRFPLYLLHPQSVVHLLREGPLSHIIRLRPAPEGEFIAVVPRRISYFRDAVQESLKNHGFTPLDELRWRLEVLPK